MINIAIFSQEFDIHALAIMRALRRREGVLVHFVATDALSAVSGLRWKSGKEHRSQIKSIEDQWVDVGELDLVWWRRVNQPQKLTEKLEEGELKDFINNEWRSALSGLLYEGFRGIWVNEPSRDAIAGNKLYQLGVAERFGFNVPQTLISQDSATVLEFGQHLGGNFIAKKLMGTRFAPLATVEITCSELADSGIALCPSIYQERVRARRHLRVNCFGDQVHALLITSSIMDWRRDMSVPIEHYRLDIDLQTKLLNFLRLVGLEMGVFDLMIPDQGPIVWLELNTQGQFLFGEGLANYDLTSPFCDFLIERALAHERVSLEEALCDKAIS